ncbi:hypothetical protein FNV43_RR04550 [Rhamnella rubrinervis]|uniref:Late embryogenesis abundant protein LEA-2 subgroup domain-containing protein n=1 Tax=Rhamnella rubrinervis TaxID=2594499 RepID=A0A8K0MQC8_9ROSA|nr:hypothetical protein FNV43_RR04550 [Rhamnella rubrinervis]
MADRVHPRDDSPQPTLTSPNNSSELAKQPTPPAPEKPVPPPGTYVIQIPKDQVYRVPPPENAKRCQQYSRRKPRRSYCCCCLCWLLGLIFIFIVLVGIAAGILYLVYRPESPKYAIEDVAVKGINITSSSSVISPKIDVTVRAENPNDKIGIYYKKDSSVRVYYSDVKLCDGVLPAFYQPSNNVTVFKTTLAGSGIELTENVNKALRGAQGQGKVPLELKLRAPVKIKIGSVKTWKITVKVNCDVTVDKLTADAKIVSKDCGYGVDLW